MIDLPYDCNAGVIFVSTRGSYRVPDNMGGFLVGDGSDVLGFCAVNTGSDTAGFWVRLFDSSEAGITPRNALTGLDVFGMEIETVPLEDSGNYEFGITFFFTPHKNFKVNGVQVGGPSQLFVGTSVGDTYTVNGPVTEFNEPAIGPALNGPVENISVMENPFIIP